MKTNDQIQLALSLCKRNHCSKSCPYHGEGACYVKLHSDAAREMRMLAEHEWNLFDLITTVWHGKAYYFKQDDGMIYSRESCTYLTFDQALDEFASALTNAKEVQI